MATSFIRDTHIGYVSLVTAEILCFQKVVYFYIIIIFGAVVRENLPLRRIRGYRIPFFKKSSKTAADAKKCFPDKTPVFLAMSPSSWMAEGLPQIFSEGQQGRRLGLGPGVVRWVGGVVVDEMHV